MKYILIFVGVFIVLESILFAGIYVGADIVINKSATNCEKFSLVNFNGKTYVCSIK